MKKYILNIDVCFECPAYEYNRDNDVSWCNELDDMVFPEKNTIDPECPLEEKAPQ